MPLKKYLLKVSEKDRGLRLDQVLANWLPAATGRPLSKARIRKLVVAGAVYLNGKRVRIASKPILPNARVEVYIDFQKLEADGPGHDQIFQMSERFVLYEDSDLIAVEKPPGLPTQPTLDESRDNLFAAVKKFLESRRKPGEPEVYLGLHHRLDRDTSGVVLFTKTRGVNAAVAELFSGRTAKKTYLALVPRPASWGGPKSWSIKNHLGKASGAGKKARFTAVRSGGDFAHTDFYLIKEMRAALLIEARPQTGRTHQIRVHLAEYGLPIFGDSHYGERSAQVPRVMLHAWKLAFNHPLTGALTLIECQLPADFRKVLEGFERGGNG